MRAEQRRSSAQRHVLTQAVGAADEIHPAVRLEQLQSGDTFVLCTDGVHDVIEPGEIRGIVLAAREHLVGACSGLIDVANERGGRDNSTVLILRCGRDATPAP